MPWFTMVVVGSATDGHSAVRQAALLQPDVVLLDINMPGINGLVELVNRTWQRRGEITPDTRTRQRPTPMALFKLLPQTNCKQLRMT